MLQYEKKIYNLLQDEKRQRKGPIVVSAQISTFPINMAIHYFPIIQLWRQSDAITT